MNPLFPTPIEWVWLSLALAVPILFYGAAWYWGRSAARRQGGGAWRVAELSPLAALAITELSVLLHVLRPLAAFSGAFNHDASERAAALAGGGVMDALSESVPFVVAGLAVAIPGIAAAILATLRTAPTRARRETEP